MIISSDALDSLFSKLAEMLPRFDANPRVSPLKDAVISAYYDVADLKREKAAILSMTGSPPQGIHLSPDLVRHLMLISGE